jgi:hypothetical protein
MGIMTATQKAGISSLFSVTKDFVAGCFSGRAGWEPGDCTIAGFTLAWCFLFFLPMG